MESAFETSMFGGGWITESEFESHFVLKMKNTGMSFAVFIMLHIDITILLSLTCHNIITANPLLFSSCRVKNALL